MNKIKGLWWVVGLSASLCLHAQPSSNYDDYCSRAGGEVKTMYAEFDTSSGLVKGNVRRVCHFEMDGGSLSIGLETFAAPNPSLAATLMKRLEEISENSPLWQGSAANPSHNVCHNLGGTTIGLVASGSFTDELGQVDMCVFGDGSMVSAWTLIYMANHRAGYDEIKEKVNAPPLNIRLPSIFISD